MRDLVIDKIWSFKTNRTELPNGLFGKHGRYAGRTKEGFKILSDKQLLAELEYVTIYFVTHRP
jgi:hypothetical protein